MTLVPARICYSCGSTTTYIEKRWYPQWYELKKGKWFCSRCRARLKSNPKWHPIHNAKRSKDQMRILAKRYTRIHLKIKKELENIPLTNKAQFDLHEEYKKTRSSDLRSNYRKPPVDTILKCVRKVKEKHAAWQPEYDKKYFDFERSELRSKDPELFAILHDLTEQEKPIMLEALECTVNGYLRASLVLGWAASMYRLHKVVEKMGFDTFSKKSHEMSTSQIEHFKKGKAVNVRNLSELQVTVVDSNLLWVLEYCEYLDAIQHRRLESSLNYRNTSAHPNSTDINYHNVKSFYSDLKNLVFDNAKLRL